MKLYIVTEAYVRRYHAIIDRLYSERRFNTIEPEALARDFGKHFSGDEMRDWAQFLDALAPEPEPWPGEEGEEG